MSNPQTMDRPVLYAGAVAARYGTTCYWIPAHARRAVRRLWRAWKEGRPFVRLVGEGDPLGGLIVPGPDRGGPAGTVCLVWVETLTVG